MENLIRKNLPNRMNVLLIILIFLLCMLMVKVLFPSQWEPVSRLIAPVKLAILGKKTVSQVIVKIQPKLGPGLEKLFIEKGGSYPPPKLSLVVLKKESVMEVWFADRNMKNNYLKTYPILAESGLLGPKLMQGDLQIPEGMYKILYLNPASYFHLSMKLNYPNEFDFQMARIDKRKYLGDDIFIHGSNDSVGCIAIGNDAIEELFLLVHAVGFLNVRIVIAPYDFRKLPYPLSQEQKDYKWIDKPDWLPVLYHDIRQALLEFQQIQ